MAPSVKVFNIPRGFEQDLARALLNNKFELTKLAVNNSHPFDTVFEFKDPSMGKGLAAFINSEIRSLRGRPVHLKAELVSNICQLKLFMTAH